MPTVPIYNYEGAQTGTLELDPVVFAVPANPSVFHQVVVAQHANARQVLAHTKTRGEVRGGGRKPWRQKGTGRARHGSIRSPLWVGGGVVFGPRGSRNYAVKVNTKMRRQAIRMALSEKVASTRFLVLDAFAPAGAKTSAAKRVLDAVLRHTDAPQQRRSPSVLVVLASAERANRRSIQNLSRVRGIDAEHLNVADLLRHDVCVLTVAAVDRIAHRFAPARH